MRPSGRASRKSRRSSNSLSELRDKPAGTIRITAGDHAIRSLLWPKLAKFLPNYPDIKVELAIDYGLTDIVAERYDAGVRLGEQVAKDMIAVRVGPGVRFAVVGAKSYFAKRSPLKAPQDLIAHNCVNLRLPTYGGLYAWEFEKGGRELRVRVEGQLVFSSVFDALDAALARLGSPLCRRTSLSPIPSRVASSGRSRNGARPGRATTSTIRAAGNTRQPSPRWSMRCAIETTPGPCRIRRHACAWEASR